MAKMLNNIPLYDFFKFSNWLDVTDMLKEYYIVCIKNLYKNIEEMLYVHFYSNFMAANGPQVYFRGPPVHLITIGNNK